MHLAAVDQSADRRHEAVEPAAARRPTPWCRASRRTSRRRRPGRRADGRRPKLAQVVGGFLRRPERDEVAQPLVDGKQRHALAVALGPERRVQLLGGEAGDEEVAIVDQRVADAGVGEVGGELGLPHPLGQPEARGVHPEPAAHGLAHPADLLHPVARGAATRAPARRSPRAAARSCPSRRQPAEAVEVGGSCCSSHSSSGPERWKTPGRNSRAARCVEQRAIHVVHVLLEDVVEVADGLMEMQSERETDRRHASAERRGSASRRAPPPARAARRGRASSRSASSAARRWPPSSASPARSAEGRDQLLGVARSARGSAARRSRPRRRSR